MVPGPCCHGLGCLRSQVDMLLEVRSSKNTQKEYEPENEKKTCAVIVFTRRDHSYTVLFLFFRGMDMPTEAS